MDQLSHTWLHLKSFMKWLHSSLCSANCSSLGFLQKISINCSLTFMKNECFNAFICFILKRFLQPISQSKCLVFFGALLFIFVFLMHFLITSQGGTIFTAHNLIWKLSFGEREDIPGNKSGNISTAQSINILIWKWPFGQRENVPRNVCAIHYGFHDCYLTDNQSAFNQSDVVVFHHNDIGPSIETLPMKEWRPHLQKWVWFSLESPSHNRKINQLNGIFNWTMSYRQDSDIFVPYGQLIPNVGHPYTIPKKISCLATWVVSNYMEHHKRTTISRNLQKYITIDIYGRANGKPLNQDSLLQTISQYPFYLAFENSIHRDYITEKLWRNSFMSGSVPVVLGPPRSNYEKFIPAGSFIHVDDFPSTQELAEYLKTVANNETLYKQYFEWKKQFTVKLWNDWTELFCQICKKYKTLPQRKVYDNFEEWMNS